MVKSPEQKPARELTPEQLSHRDQLLDLFREHGGHPSAVARSLQKNRTQITRWVAGYAIDLNSLRQ